MGTRPRGLLGPVVPAGLPGSARHGRRLARPGRGESGPAGSESRRRYSCSTLKVWMIMGEQLLKNSILDQFINSHEQSYEEFLNTFTYLLEEKEGKKIQGSKVDSLRKTCSTSELPNRNKQDGSPERSKEMWVSFPPEMPNENETVMSESSTAGVSDRNNLSLSERVKVDKYLNLEDVDTDEETCSGLSFTETVFWEECYLLGNDVQPFSLDEEFDYDNVALTPKFSEAELKAIVEFSEEKKTSTMSNQHELKTE
ncbi:intraflagellar transport-associated protein isoform X4 [Aphelocoma coerulescens]|uniref:intraflagellar transport-associated protein isoform X4 n=1 Tax=Aphelocoma coerulescens TaxID=39617 RepID=UPI003604E00B